MAGFILPALLASGTTALAGESHLEVRIGETFVDDIKHTDGAVKSLEEYRPGFAAELIWDHRYDSNFRVITSVSFQHVKFDKIHIVDDGGWGVFYTGTSWDGVTLNLEDSSANVYAAWLKGAYDIEINNKIGAFVGLGVGVSSINVEVDDFGIEDNGGDNASLSLQGFAGATWALDVATNLVAEYQYAVVKDVETDYGLGPSTAFDVKAHTVFLGIRTSF